jgi:hypothetical protein
MAQKPKKTKKRPELRTVSVRNVSIAQWLAVRKKIKERGRTLESVFKEFMDEWLNKPDPPK